MWTLWALWALFRRTRRIPYIHYTGERRLRAGDGVDGFVLKLCSFLLKKFLGWRCLPPFLAPRLHLFGCCLLGLEIWLGASVQSVIPDGLETCRGLEDVATMGAPCVERAQPRNAFVERRELQEMGCLSVMTMM